MASTGKGNSAAVRLTAIDDTAAGVKQAGETIKSLENLEPVKIKGNASEMEKSISEIQAFVAKRREGGYSDEVLGVGRVSTLSKLRTGVNSIGKDIQSGLKSNFLGGISSVAIGTMIANGITSAVRSSMEFVFDSTKVWDRFEEKAKTAFANALSKGFTGNFDSFAKNMMRQASGASQAFNVNQEEYAGSYNIMSRAYSGTELENKMATISKLATITGKSMEEFATMFVKIPGGAVQSKKLAELGIAMPKGMTGEEQGSEVTNIFNSWVAKMMQVDDSAISNDRPIEQLVNLITDIKLGLGEGLDGPIKDIVSFLRNELLGNFGSMQEFGKIISEKVIAIADSVVSFFGFFGVIGSAVMMIVKLIGAIGTGILHLLTVTVQKVAGWLGFDWGKNASYTNEMSAWAGEWGQSFGASWGSMKNSAGLMGGVSTMTMRPSDTAKTGAAINAQNRQNFEQKASADPGVKIDARVYAADREKKAEKLAKENVSKQTIILQAPYGARPAFANTYNPAAGYGRPIRRY